MQTDIQVQDGALVVPLVGMTEAEVEGLREKAERYARNRSIRRTYRRSRDDGASQQEALDALALKHGRSVATIEKVLGWK